MEYEENMWVKGFPGAITISDTQGIVLEINDASAKVFEEDGGRGIIGKNMLDCHPDPSLDKLQHMLENQTSNAYFNSENSEKRFFFQSPWYRDGRYTGFVEISFQVPEIIPHFIRE